MVCLRVVTSFDPGYLCTIALRGKNATSVNKLWVRGSNCKTAAKYGDSYSSLTILLFQQFLMTLPIPYFITGADNI